MSEQEKDSEHIEKPSRRTFPGAGSAALATAALVGLSANAQQREDTRKTERDHSSSDPGQENKPLLDENPNSNTPPPTDHVDIGPLWYSFDLARKRLRKVAGRTGDTARAAYLNRSHRREHADHPWHPFILRRDERLVVVT